MRFLLLLTLFAIPVLLPYYSYAQNIPQKTAQSIQHSAIQNVNQLEILLIGLTDESTTDAEKLRFISNSLDPSSIHCIFVDDKVIIEDDYSDPSFTDHTKAVDRSVDTYLSNLDAFYTSSTVPSIKFSNIKAGKVQIKNDNIWVRVYFESEFKNPHKKSKKNYQKTKRVATVKAQKVGASYRTFIAGISFYKPEDAKEFFPEGEVKEEPKPQPEVKTEQPPVIIEQPTVSAKYSIDVKDAYKRGKDYPFDWKGGRPSDQVTLDLYKGDTKVSTLFSGSNKGSTQYVIPSNAKPGSDYTIRMSENGNEATQSENFKIKRKLPFILKPLAVAAVVVAAYIIIDPCFGDDCEPDELPDPVLPKQQ
jgi:hypothetical protein